MKHCINNNYSFAGFWRLWHATLNKWIIRYMCAKKWLLQLKLYFRLLTSEYFCQKAPANLCVYLVNFESNPRPFLAPTPPLQGMYRLVVSAPKSGACGSFSLLSVCGTTSGAMNLP